MTTLSATCICMLQCNEKFCNVSIMHTESDKTGEWEGVARRLADIHVGFLEQNG